MVMEIVKRIGCRVVTASVTGRRGRARRGGSGGRVVVGTTVVGRRIVTVDDSGTKGVVITVQSSQ
jgi:hypothetical protein